MGSSVMMMLSAQVAAAAAAQARREEEEETLTSYTAEDVGGDWEFKIVRAPMAAFRSRGRLEELVAEEAVSGWEMLEKLDDRRVRFKRPKKARERDGELPATVDPYQTRYASEEGVATMVLVILLTLLLAPALIVGAMFVSFLAVLLAVGLVVGLIWLMI